jgi:hypothetical protein
MKPASSAWSTPRIAHRLRGLIIATVMSSGVAACFAWTPSPPPAPTPVAAFVADKARIVLADGRTYEVTNLIVLRDSLLGQDVVRKGVRVAVAARDVGSIETRQLQSKRGWLITGIVLLVMVATGMITVEEG